LAGPNSLTGAFLILPATRIVHGSMEEIPPGEIRTHGPRIRSFAGDFLSNYMNSYYMEKTEKRDSRHIARSSQRGLGWTLYGHCFSPSLSCLVIANITSTRCFGCLEQCALTLENVIPQALNGRLRRKLYYASCKSFFGSTIDPELANVFGYLGTFLRIRRQRDSNQPFEVKEVGTNLALSYLINGLVLINRAC